MNYPGGTLFDSLGLAEDATAFEAFTGYEVEKRSSCIVIRFGIYVQALSKQKGTIDNLCSFPEDTLH